MMADNIEHVISYWVIYELFQWPELQGLCGHQPLVAVPAAVVVRGSALRPLRLPPGDPVGDDPVLRTDHCLGLLHHDRDPPGLARLRAPGGARCRRSVVEPRKPAHPARHGRPGIPSERGPSQRHGPAVGDSDGAGPGRLHDADVGCRMGPGGERPFLSSADPVAFNGPLYRTRPQRGAAAPGHLGPGPGGPSGGPLQPRHRFDGVSGGPLIVAGGQRLPGADARVRRQPWQGRGGLQHSARRQRGRRLRERRPAGEQGIPPGPGAHRHCAGHSLVRRPRHFCVSRPTTIWRWASCSPPAS